MNDTVIKPQMISINDKRELYKSYMPFVKGGGLFIPFNDNITINNIAPGKRVFIILTILDGKTKHTINGKVIWIGRTGAVKGFGVSFGESPAMKALKETIDVNIAELVAKKDLTYTI